MSDINSFKEKLQNLIVKLEKDKHHYLSKDYLEAKVRQDFINPFFEALGWDIENRKGLPPFYSALAQVKRGHLAQLPIPLPDFTSSKDKALYNKLLSLVDSMLELHKKKNSLPPSTEREKIEREIAVTDENIDEIVYRLYGVTEGERKIIENN